MIHRGTLEIETKRLILRKIKVEDATKVYNSWATDANTNKYLNWELHVDINETITIIDKWVDEYYYGSYRWVVEEKESHELIGMINAKDVIDKYNIINLRFAYASKYWMVGYATEALNAVIDFFFNDCEVHLIECKTIKSNVAALRVMEKAGMKKEAILKDRIINKVTKDYDDLVIYSIINK